MEKIFKQETDTGQRKKLNFQKQRILRNMNSKKLGSMDSSQTRSVRETSLTNNELAIFKWVYVYISLYKCELKRYVLWCLVYTVLQ